MLTLRAVPGVGDIGVADRLARYGSAEAAVADLPVATRAVAAREADRVLATLAEAGAAAVVLGDTRYPSRVRELRDAPPVLFLRGTNAVHQPPAVAIVGTRAASAYGLRVARAIAAVCARAGVAVISGLARGIDAAAHEATLEAGGRTVAVLGTGVDVYYPRTHRTLQERIARDGLLVSELAPGDTGHSGTFPRRNRIIAALADVTVVVEAGRGSGALITADHALELGRTVACVPNAIDLPSSLGSNALLKAGAEPLLAPDDVLALLKIDHVRLPGPSLDPLAARCWDAVSSGAREIVDIARIAKLSTRETVAVLSALEIDGLLSFDVAGAVRPTVGHL